MNTTEQIAAFLISLPANKVEELKELHQMILAKTGETLLHFFDGKNEEGKIVANPTIGFGQTRLTYANGSFQDTFRLGISANATGISIYIIGLKDKNILKEKFGPRIGKAKITGYCIRFKRLGDLDRTVLAELVAFAFHEVH
ncbi:MAG: hypothetical protein RLY35_1033 [Bacteroidota bacterium]